MSEQELKQEAAEIAELFRNKEVPDEEILSRIKAMPEVIHAKLPSTANLFLDSVLANRFEITKVLVEMGSDIQLKCKPDLIRSNALNVAQSPEQADYLLSLGIEIEKKSHIMSIGEMTMERGKEFQLSEIISMICSLYKKQGLTAVYQDNGWCVYSSEEDVSLESICYVDDYPEFDDDDNEIYSEYVLSNNMELIYRDEMIQDVVIACLNQKDDVSLSEIMEALNYYDEYDDFLEL